MNGDDQSFAELMDLLWQSLCKTSQNGGGGQVIRSPTGTQGTEEAFALIGFGLGRRCQLDLHAGKVDTSSGGSAEPDPFRQELHLLCPSRKRQPSATDVEDIKGLAWAAGVGAGHRLVEATYVPLCVRGVGLPSIETALRIKRSRIDQGPSEQASIDSNQLLELPSMGLQREDSEAGSPRSPPLGGSRSIDPEDSFFGSSSGPDPLVLSSETSASGFNGDGLNS